MVHRVIKTAGSLRSKVTTVDCYFYALYHYWRLSHQLHVYLSGFLPWLVQAVEEPETLFSQWNFATVLFVHATCFVCCLQTRILMFRTSLRHLIFSLVTFIIISSGHALSIILIITQNSFTCLLILLSTVVSYGFDNDESSPNICCYEQLLGLRTLKFLGGKNHWIGDSLQAN